jgi:hypothetical protein
MFVADSDLITVNYDLVPRRLSVKENYSTEQRNQILEMMKIYRNVLLYAGRIQGIGSELDAPEFNALEILLEVKKQADLLPPKIKQLDPKPFETIEEAIRYCQK